MREEGNIGRPSQTLSSSLAAASCLSPPLAPPSPPPATLHLPPHPSSPLVGIASSLPAVTSSALSVASGGHASQRRFQGDAGPSSPLLRRHAPICGVLAIVHIASGGRAGERCHCSASALAPATFPLDFFSSPQDHLLRRKRALRSAIGVEEEDHARRLPSHGNNAVHLSLSVGSQLWLWRDRCDPSLHFRFVSTASLHRARKMAELQLLHTHPLCRVWWNKGMPFLLVCSLREASPVTPSFCMLEKAEITE